MISLLLIGAIILLLAAFAFAIFAGIYTLVPADQADIVIQNGVTKIYSSHKEYNNEGRSAYFKIPEWFFLFNLGMVVHRIPLKIIEIDVRNFLAFDKDRARFVCDIVAYVTVKDPMVAAKRFSGNISVMQQQVANIIQTNTRDVTTKKTIREVINNRDDIIKIVSPVLSESIKHWGLELNTIELLDFKDPPNSHVIEDISNIIENGINSEMRQKNAEQNKEARMKEAIAEEEAKKRELQKDENIQKRQQEVIMNVAEQQKLAKEKELQVLRTVTVTNANIQKEQQIVIAEQQLEVEKINKEQKILIGEGDRLRAEEQAKGDAAPIREKGLAEADAKEALQEALNKFGDTAIRALIAEKTVDANKEVGLANAKALELADIRILSGGSKEGFNTGNMIESIKLSSPDAASSELNKIARPLDLGFTELIKDKAVEIRNKKKNKNKQGEVN